MTLTVGMTLAACGPSGRTVVPDPDDDLVAASVSETPTSSTPTPTATPPATVQEKQAKPGGDPHAQKGGKAAGEDVVAPLQPQIINVRRGPPGDDHGGGGGGSSGTSTGTQVAKRRSLHMSGNVFSVLRQAANYKAVRCAVGAFVVDSGSGEVTGPFDGDDAKARAQAEIAASGAISALSSTPPGCGR